MWHGCHSMLLASFTVNTWRKKQERSEKLAVWSEKSVSEADRDVSYRNQSLLKTSPQQEKPRALHWGNRKLTWKGSQALARPQAFQAQGMKFINSFGRPPLGRSEGRGSLLSKGHLGKCSTGFSCLSTQKLLEPQSKAESCPRAFSSP